MTETTEECKELNQPPCYVVVEEDRGMGATVEAVFLDKEQAEALANTSSHLYVEESVLYSHNNKDGHA